MTQTSAVESAVIADRRLDLQLGSELHEELAFDPRGAVEAADHARNDARQRLGEDRGGQTRLRPASL